MPEGHTVHRTAHNFQRHFADRTIAVDSPQGRFEAGAALINGRKLVTASAIGKQLFLAFDNGLTLRIHLGIYGKWAWHSGEAAVKQLLAEPAVGQVRARFWSANTLAELRGPTVCEVITDEEVARLAARLGPDPINPDPTGSESQRFADRVSRSKTTIGQLLMDQSVVSGIGNVYRAELLFRAKLDPYTAGERLRPKQVTALWQDSVRLLAIGVKTGFMITREELFEANPTKEERNFVYKREGQPCRVCGTKISLAMMVGRKLYWCSKCQK